MLSSIRYSVFCLGIGLLGLIPVYGVNKCCSTVGHDLACSGCQVMGNSTNAYVYVGSNSTKRCQGTQAPLSCDADTEVCVYIEDLDMHDNSTCSHVIGKATLEITVAQCDSSDDECAAGG